jgi:hypothetical protein
MLLASKLLNRNTRAEVRIPKSFHASLIEPVPLQHRQNSLQWIYGKNSAAALDHDEMPLGRSCGSGVSA